MRRKSAFHNSDREDWKGVAYGIVILALVVCAMLAVAYTPWPT